MSKILVTGANGYIGRHITNKLKKAGHIVIQANRGIHNNEPSIDIFSGDRDLYYKIGCPDALIHLAWEDGFQHNSNAHMRNLSNHFVFLSNMIDNGLKYLSVMGSMHEIGYWEGEVNENTPCNPLSQYGIAKNALRQSLELYTKNKQCSFHWLRAFYITGDEEHSKNIFSKILRAVKQETTSFPFTSGKNKYDFIDVEILSDMIIQSTLQSKYTGIINCCSGYPTPLSEKVENFIKDNHLNIQLEYGVYPERDYDSPCIWGNAEKIKQIMSCAGKGIL